ncbi:Myosin-4 [Toxocara canis]|uniref:Myosin-4 n=1 Tax=Toxocara canis TaxID=6265 RepID=A0A0B2VVW7_TOXCA|nr:Myosin-4 [Toxocara canis]
MEYESDPGWQYLRQSREQMIADQSKPYDSKKDCWVPDAEEGFVTAQIKSTKGDMVSVVTSRGNEITLKAELVQEMNPPKFEKTEDMSNLTFLNDASVLHNLRARYGSMLIYTYSGLFCVVINPYKRLPIYTDSVASMFMGKRRTEMPPHLFAVSDEAYRNMLQDHENQSMLITGESGAGKTENTKKVIAYFAVVGASQQGETTADGKKKVTLEDQIVQTNPVLEAFGNARTVRNNNSSRFGKFIRIHFSKKGKVASCDIEHYLLEKSRVIRQAPGERCYHIFYQVYSDYIPTLKKDLLLDRPLKEYYFCAQAELTIDGVNDKEEHQLTDEAFDILHFSPEEKLNCYKLVAAIMHMGNMKFKQRPREEQAEPDGTDEAEKAASMFGVNHEEFLKALTRPRVKVGTEWVAKGQNIDQVTWAVGAMAKGLYARTFNWLVKKCNITLDQKGIPRDYFIGVLDIAGFEIFDFNSFEQLWINFVNEKLQQFFNHHMFVLEQEEYAREGIQWTFIDFGLDLQACIELIEKPMGIISILDEECIVPKATDLTLAQKLNDQHLGKHPNFEKPKPPKGKQGEAHFAMRHYAGTVRYNVMNWLEKNKDPLNDTVVSVMKATQGNDLLNEVWKDYVTQEEAAALAKEGGGGKKHGKSGSFMTVSMLYRESLNNLMTMLNMTHPHFIRCIIPNEKKTSGLIEAGLVLNQLTCNGVLEGIRICRKGFPNRMLHPDFRHRYSVLAAEEASSSPDAKKCAEAILAKLISQQKLTEENFKMGDTKVFFKAGVLARLEDIRDEVLKVIMTKFQAYIRWYIGLIDRKRRIEQNAATVVLQRNIHMWCSLRTWEWFKLYTKVRPMLREGKIAEQMEKLNEKLKSLEEGLEKESKLHKELEDNSAKMLAEKNDLMAQLESTKAQLAEAEERLQRETALKGDIDKQLEDLNERLAQTEDKNEDLMRAKKKAESEVDALKKQIQDLEMSVRKAESEKQSKDHQIRSIQDEMQMQDETIAKLNKEKKHQEELNKKINDDLQSEEDKSNHINKIKAKLEQTLDDLEENLERERRAKADTEKAKRKVEGELKIAQENIEEVTRQKHDLDNNLKRKEAEMNNLSSRLEEEQSIVSKLQRQIKEAQSRVGELEEELEGERESRSKTDRAKSDLQRELEELNERLDEQGGATATQIELNRKREAELAKLRRDIEEANMNHEAQLASLRKKHSDAVAELTDQLDLIEKQRQKLEKEKAQAVHDSEGLASQLDSETAAKTNNEKLAKQLEMQLADLQSKADEQGRQLQDFASIRGRLGNEGADLARQLEELEEQVSALHRVKAQLSQQVEETRQAADEEARERQALSAQSKNLQIEAEQAQNNLDEEIESKNEVMRQLSKANAEIQQWQSKFEGDGLLRADEIEEMKRKQGVKINELQEALEAANQKILSLEKSKSRLVGDLDDAQVDVERANSYAAQLEKKQKGFDKVVEEWKKKSDDLSAEVDAAQRDARNLSTDLIKMKTNHEELMETVDALRRENKGLSNEIKDLTDQLGEGGRSAHETQKVIRRLEVEKEELQHGLDEAEAALEAEESKVMRAQVEVAQIRSEVEKRIQEKEEEFESTRRNHQKALESMQASLEAESKSKNELLRVKKKLEADINELEIALDHANKANADAQKNLKRYTEQTREVQLQIEEEQRQRDEMKEQYYAAEKRVTLLQSEKEELAASCEHAERARKQAELDAADGREQANELIAQTSSLSATKRKLEGELQAIHADLDETLNEFRASEESSKKAMAEAEHLADEVRKEQEHAAHVERMRVGLETQIRELQIQVDEAEQAALKGGKKVIMKLEQRTHDLEAELDGEQRRHQEISKNVAKAERHVRELQFQVDEDKKNFERMQDLVEKLQSKIKTQKKQLEEAEELANLNLQKYRQIQHQLEDAEERAESAESSVAKMRAKTRTTVSVSSGAVTVSQSTTAVGRSASTRPRTTSFVDY